MSEKYINKIALRLILTVIVFFTYIYVVQVGEIIAKFIGFDEMTIYQFVAMIVYSSIAIFFITLILNFLFQKLPFLTNDLFVTTFYAMHVLFLYISGFLVTLVSIQPLLNNMGYLISINDNEISQMFILIFFIILSNYYIYDVIIVQNKLNLLKEDRLIRLVLIYRIFLFIFSVSWMIRLLIFGPKDEINIVWGMLVVAPSVINRIFFNNPDLSLD